MYVCTNKPSLATPIPSSLPTVRLSVSPSQSKPSFPYLGYLSKLPTCMPSLPTLLLPTLAYFLSIHLPCRAQTVYPTLLYGDTLYPTSPNRQQSRTHPNLQANCSPCLRANETRSQYITPDLVRYTHFQHTACQHTKHSAIQFITYIST